MTRARYTGRDHAEDGQGEQIDFSITPPTNAIIKTITATWSGIPANPGALTVTKDSGHGSDYDCILLSIEPSECGLVDYADVPLIEVLKGDKLDVFYSNPDNIDCSCELILEQV